jgi:PAS domain S-box-containing protein
MPETPIDIEDIDLIRQNEASRSGAAPAEESIVVVEKGIIQNSDAAMTRLSGYRHEEVVDTIFASFFHLDDIPVVESVCDPPEAPGNSGQKLVVRLIGKDGQSIPVQISAGACSRDGKPIRQIKIRHI